MIDENLVNLGIPLLGLLCGLFALAIGKNKKRIDALERQILGDKTQ